MQEMVRKITWGSLLAVLILVTSGCLSPQATGTPTTDPQMVLTSAAETASVRLTESAELTPSATATQVTPTPELAVTAAFATVSAQLTQQALQTPSPTVTQSTPQATPTSGQAAQNERAEFVADVTVPDGTDFAPGTAFTKTWRLRNAGTSTWTTAYALVYVSGERMNGPDRVSLPSTVAPGATVDISVNLTAPSATGRFRGDWKLLNASGQFVNDAVYVEIDVVQGAGVTATPGATPTATTAGPASVTNVSTSVDASSYSGACPHTFNFTGKFTLNRASPVTFRFEAGSATPGVTFTLPGAQTVNYPAGEQVVSISLEFTQSLDGYVQLHITSPVDVTSNQATFSLTCQP
jgi:hypothetical protein